MQEVARYPNEIIQSSSNQYCGPTYPSLLLPFSRIHVKVGGCSTRPGKSLYILALPAGFPLALGFADTLSRHTMSLFESDKSSEQLKECGVALSVCLESLCKVITRLNCPQLLKVPLLHLMADILWTLCTIFPPPNQDGSSESERPKLYSFQNEFLQTVRQELMRLYETETSKFSPGRSKSSSSAHSFPPHGSIGTGGSGKFSTYFQAVLEFVLAVYKYQHQFHDSDLLPASPSTLTTSSLTVTPPPVARSTSSEATPTSSSAASTVASSASWATPTSSSDVAKKPAKRTRSRKGLSRKESQGDSTSKKKDDWLSTVHVAAGLLRKIARQDPGSYLPQIHWASLNSCQGKTKPNSRLVVVTGINVKLGVEDVRKGIEKICNVYGGLYQNGLYLPTEPYRDETNTDIKESLESEKDQGNKERKETNEMNKDQNVAGDDSTSYEVAPSPKERLLGYAVLDLCSSTQVTPVTTALLSSPTLKHEDSSIQVCAVGDRLKCGEDELASNVLFKYLSDQLVENDCLKDLPKKALSEIFTTSANEEGLVSLSTVSNNLHRFLSALTFDSGTSLEQLTSNVMKPFANEQGLLSLDKFLSWVCVEAKIYNEDVKQDMDGEGLKQVWLGLLASGYDFHFER